jgi:predicted GNAT superfamily acetyltransferase
MQKKFYISSNSEESKGGVNAPKLDRFRRVEQLNDMLSRGWSIKEFKNEGDDSYFLLEKIG